MCATVTATDPVYRQERLREVRAWVDLEDDWTALLRFAVVGREFVLAEVRAFARDGDDRRTHWSGSAAAARRALPVRRLQRLSLLDVEHHVEREFADALPVEDVDPLTRLLGSGWGTEDVTPRERWALVALTYALAIERGEEAPTQRTAEIVGRSYTKVRDDLHAARRAGFLTAGGGRGVSGGELTDEGWAMVTFLEDDQLERYRRALGR